MSDRVIVITEQIAENIRDILVETGLTKFEYTYLERYVNEVLIK